jgi:serine phosphatase RsbU (regulator of sigma subunit)
VFTTHEIQIKKGTHLYLFTAGYADQFGGRGGKKFKNKALKELLINFSTLPVDQQIEKLHQHFINWKNNLDQVDDIAIAVIRFA